MRDTINEIIQMLEAKDKSSYTVTEIDGCTQISSTDERGGEPLWKITEQDDAISIARLDASDYIITATMWKPQLVMNYLKKRKII